MKKLSDVLFEAAETLEAAETGGGHDATAAGIARTVMDAAQGAATNIFTEISNAAMRLSGGAAVPRS